MPQLANFGSSNSSQHRDAEMAALLCQCQGLRFHSGFQLHPLSTVERRSWHLKTLQHGWPSVGHRLAIGHFRLTDLVSRPDTDLSELLLWDLPPVASVPMLQWDILGHSGTWPIFWGWILGVLLKDVDSNTFKNQSPRIIHIYVCICIYIQV